RRVIMFRLASLTLLVVLLFAGRVAAAPTMHQGKVTGVGKAEIMLIDMKDGETETFQVPDGTTIVVDGKPGKLSEIQVGFVAEITAEREEGKLVAKRIVASSRRSP